MFVTPTILALTSCALNDDDILFSTGPYKVDYPVGTEFTREDVETCTNAVDLGNDFSLKLSPYERQGFIVDITGKDLRLSTDEMDVWERFWFIVDIERFINLTRVQFVSLDGVSTYSAGDVKPEWGPRWEPLDGPDSALLRANGEVIFSSIARCIGNRRGVSFRS